MENYKILSTVRAMKNSLIILKGQVDSIETRILNDQKSFRSKLKKSEIEPCAHCGGYNVRARIKTKDILCRTCGKITALTGSKDGGKK